VSLNTGVFGKVSELAMQGYRFRCRVLQSEACLPKSQVMTQAKLTAQNSLLSSHFGPAPSKVTETLVAPYTDESFIRLAVEWMIVTDQACIQFLTLSAYSISLPYLRYLIAYISL
jgi:hypothetical protein